MRMGIYFDDDALGEAPAAKIAIAAGTLGIADHAMILPASTASKHARSHNFNSCSSILTRLGIAYNVVYINDFNDTLTGLAVRNATASIACDLLVIVNSKERSDAMTNRAAGISKEFALKKKNVLEVSAANLDLTEIIKAAVKLRKKGPSNG